MTSQLSIHASNALSSLSDAQLAFLKSLPKAELHAHLNGSIPLPVLKELANASETRNPEIERLQNGVELNELHDFFDLFPAIYALTSTPSALSHVTRAVLQEFIPNQVSYLELRSGPRETPHMTRLQYVEAVLDEVEKYGPDEAALIVSLDRRMSVEVAAECIDVAIKMKNSGRRVVGVDLCGNPTVSNLICSLVVLYLRPIGWRYGNICDPL